MYCIGVFSSLSYTHFTYPCYHPCRCPLPHPIRFTAASPAKVTRTQTATTSSWHLGVAMGRTSWGRAGLMGTLTWLPPLPSPHPYLTALLMVNPLLYFAVFRMVYYYNWYHWDFCLAYIWLKCEIFLLIHITIQLVLPLLCLYNLTLSTLAGDSFPEMSPGSSCSFTSGTPSSDHRFPDFIAEKGGGGGSSYYYGCSEDDDSSLDRPIRTNSVGSKPEQFRSRKNRWVFALGLIILLCLLDSHVWTLYPVWFFAL